jgi:hypothetical protein
MLDIVLMTAQLVWLAKSTLQAGSGNPIIEASSIAICAIYFTNQVPLPAASCLPCQSCHHANYFCLQLLRSVAPPLGSLVEEQSRTEGQYRATQSRVISFRCRLSPNLPLHCTTPTVNSRLCSEEIAFYKGAEVEKRRIMDSFQSMLKQIMKVSTSSPSVLLVMQGHHSCCRLPAFARLTRS